MSNFHLWNPTDFWACVWFVTIVCGIWMAVEMGSRGADNIRPWPFLAWVALIGISALRWGSFS